MNLHITPNKIPQPQVLIIGDPTDNVTQSLSTMVVTSSAKAININLQTDLDLLSEPHFLDRFKTVRAPIGKQKAIVDRDFFNVAIYITSGIPITKFIKELRHRWEIVIVVCHYKPKTEVYDIKYFSYSAIAGKYGIEILKQKIEELTEHIKYKNLDKVGTEIIDLWRKNGITDHDEIAQIVCVSTKTVARRIRDYKLHCRQVISGTSISVKPRS